MLNLKTEIKEGETTILFEMKERKQLCDIYCELKEKNKLQEPLLTTTLNTNTRQNNSHSEIHVNTQPNISNE